MQLGGANNVDTPELINGTISAYTTHYYGVIGHATVTAHLPTNFSTLLAHPHQVST